MAIRRPLFICSAIAVCKETSCCCPHKMPHIKDERCIPKECRYAPAGQSVDCVPYPMPQAPVCVTESDHKSGSVTENTKPDTQTPAELVTPAEPVKPTEEEEKKAEDEFFAVEEKKEEA